MDAVKTDRPQPTSAKSSSPNRANEGRSCTDLIPMRTVVGSQLPTMRLHEIQEKRKKKKGREIECVVLGTSTQGHALLSPFIELKTRTR